MDPVFKQALKRLMDLVLGLIILTAGVPLLIALAILIKLDSRGPVLFIQPRLGRNGQVFYCFKFRTMVRDADQVLIGLLETDPALKSEWTANFKLKKDPRLTRVGRFLRKTSLDELPQIINVLGGEMSLVGPRPRPLYEMDAKKDDCIFNTGLLMRPGITGLWQVSGRNQLNFENRLQMDALYVSNWTLWLDILLLFRTIGAVFRRDGAY